MAAKDAIKQFLNTEIYGNTGLSYVNALLIFLASLLVLKIFNLFILRQIRKFSRKSKTRIDDAIVDFIERINWKFYVILSAYIGLKTLVLLPLADKIVNYVMILVAVYYAVKFAQAMVDYFAKEQAVKRIKENPNEDTTVIDVLSKLTKSVLWVVALLFILSNFGFNITSLIAGLGIGGIAIAFALQNILEDLFSSFTIYFDKPFKKGDFIIIGQDMGTIKHIGIKSTRIQTLQGQELVVSNRELTNTRINNYKRMEKRRVVFTLGVEYSTPNKRLREIDKIVKDIFSKTKLVLLDRVHFKEFGPFSLNFEIVYFLDSSDYNVYMDTQEKINLEIKQHFEKRGIIMAYPTQTVVVRRK